MTTHPTGDAPAASEDREVTPRSTPFFDAVQSGRIKPDEGDVASERVVDWLSRKWCEWSHVHSWTSKETGAASKSLGAQRQMYCPKCNRLWGAHYFSRYE
jgi:hypothetical protein